jgi:hypothetical protein
MSADTRTRGLGIALIAFAVASLVHFTHNAEFIREYPNMRASWARGDVHVAWIAMALLGAAGWFVLKRGWRRSGLAMLAAYAACGLDSLGHYMLAPLPAHTFAMNATILIEVGAAAWVLLEVSRRAWPRSARSA